MPASNKTRVYLEVGNQRTFAGALEWPGWCRSGRDEESALQALFDYGPQYARVMRSPYLAFQAPSGPAALRVTERLKGDATTDFGAPGAAPFFDKTPVSAQELERLQAILKACWRAFDKAVRAAAGKELRKGPRGGGRELEAIVEHVVGAEIAYLARLGVKFQAEEDERKRLIKLRRAVLEGLVALARGEMPTRGPRGGLYWTPRYFVRRAAWHVLDHAWEIEDRVA